MQENERRPAILIVEDEILLAMEIKYTLEDAGYTAIGIAFSGHDALMQAGSMRPDLVLMDIKLKGYMDGVEAATRIQSEMKTPVIFLTGNSDEDTRKRAMSISPAGYLQKPYDNEALSKAISEALLKRSN